jgi:hypothetical protein
MAGSGDAGPVAPYFPYPDSSLPNYEVTTPTGYGHVFDLDGPGINGSTQINRVRQNFSEYASTASWTDSQGTVHKGQQIPSSTFPYYAVSSCVSDLGGGNPQFSNSIPGDNRAGTGATPTSWNLQ